MRLRYRFGLIGTFGVLIVLYLLQGTLYQPDPAVLEKYQLSATGIKLLGLTVSIPYIIIWLLALYGYLGLVKYTRLIKKSKDGEALRLIARGILIFTLWLPLTSVFGGFIEHLYHAHPDLTGRLVRLNNYTNLIVLAPAFWYLARGSSQLVKPINRARRPTRPRWQFVSYVAFSSIYTHIVLNDPARSHATSTVPVATYYQNDWVILLTFVIPRLVMWLYGLSAIFNLYYYQQTVKGKLYRAALRDLIVGLGGVVTFVMLLRCLQSFSTALERLSLGLVLVLVYVLLICLAVAYAFIARGARKLRKIEEL